MSKFIIVGDPHLGKSTHAKNIPGSLFNSRILDQIKILDWILEQALSLDCSRIILTGDVFDDPKPPTYLISSFIEWLNKCIDEKIYVDIIMGNHDMLRINNTYYSPLDIATGLNSDYVHVYNSISTIFENNVSITYIPFRDRKSLKFEKNIDGLAFLEHSINFEAQSIPNSFKKIAVGHLAIEGCLYSDGEIDDVANELICNKDIFKSFDYTWMGHIHKFQEVQTKPYVAHIGSMDLSDFGEADQGKYLVVFDTEKVSYDYVLVPSRRLKNISIEIPENTEDYLSYIDQQIEGLDFNEAIVKMEIKLPNNSNDINKLKINEKLKSLGVFNVSGISVIKKTNNISIKTENKISNKMDINSAINVWASNKEKIPEELKSNFITLANELHNKLKQNS